MKNKRILSIVCVAVVFVIIAVILITSLSSNNGVDKQYEYNTEVISNENAPLPGDVVIEAIEGYKEVSDQKFVDLPYVIGDTGMQVVSIGEYTGVNPELGYTEINKSLAVIVENTTDKVVSYSNFTIEYADGKKCQFVPTNIPAECSALVFVDGQAVEYKDVKKFECVDSMSVLAESLSVIEDKVGVDFKDGEFIVTNLTNENLGDVYIRFKKFSEGNAYLGGKTYSVRVENVEPYETYKLENSDFDPQTSIIISVESIIPVN